MLQTEIRELNKSQIEISWDRLNKRQVENAKSIYRQARNENRIIIDEDYTEVLNFSADLEFFIVKETSLNIDEFSVKVLDETGDRRIIWNSKNKKQVKEAALKFKEYLDDGCRIYSINKDGTKGARILSFDSELEEIVVEEKKDRATIKQKFQDFISQFKKIEVLPKTMPG